MKNETKKYLDLAVAAALKGGAVIKKGFTGRGGSESQRVKFKGFANPVTKFDHDSEQTIVDMIRKAYPKHSILAEETNTSEGTEPVRWVIDPLDGTVNFTHGIPYVCVSIGVEIDGVIEAGVIYNPMLDELYTAQTGRGAFLNGKKIKVSSLSDPAKSLIVTGFPYEREGRTVILTQTLAKINQKFTGFRRLGSAAMDMAYVACGRFEAFYEENLKPWDTAAGKVLLEEAGATVTDYYGKPYSIYGKTILASNGRLHKEMLGVLKNIRSPK
jgi:myo-inositol-1(or 4)-monophosphatase